VVFIVFLYILFTLFFVFLSKDIDMGTAGKAIITTRSAVVSTYASQAEGFGFDTRRERIFDEGIPLKKLRENDKQERRNKTRNGKDRKRLFGSWLGV